MSIRERQRGDLAACRGRRLLGFCLVAGLFGGCPFGMFGQTSGSLSILSGNNQTLRLNELGAIMEVHDALCGKGCTIAFRVVAPSGGSPATLCTVSVENTLTCPAGVTELMVPTSASKARAGVRAGTKAGAYQVTATNLATGNSVAFNLNNLPDNASRLEVVSGSNQFAVHLGQFLPLRVRITDRYGNLVTEPSWNLTFRGPVEEPKAKFPGDFIIVTSAGGYAEAAPTGGAVPGSYDVWVDEPNNLLDDAKFSLTNLGIPVLVSTNPAGLNVTVDGLPYTTPVSFNFAYRSRHSIGTASPQGSGGTRYEFSNWSDQGAQSHSIEPLTPGSIVANFQTKYLMTAKPAPANGGTITASGSPVDGSFVLSGTTVPLTATPAQGYRFTGWSGDLIGTANPQPIVMNGPRNVTANFAPAATRNITITTNPTNLLVVVDGQSYSTPRTFQWAEGSQHQIAVGSPLTTGGANWTQASGTRYLYTGWSDGGAQNHSITVPAADATYTASFATSYLLTMGSQANGTIAASPASPDGYYSAGSAVQMVATPATGYEFANWTNDLSGSANPQTLFMNGPRVVNAVFRSIGPALSLSCTTGAGPSQVNTPYSATCSAFGGTPPYAFSTSGALPAGLSFSPGSTSATISGTPTSTGAYSYLMRVTDNRAGTAQQAFSGSISQVVSSAGLVVTPASLSFIGIQGRGNPAAKALSVTSKDGSSLNFTITSPPWLSVNPASGTATDSPQTLTVTPSLAGLPPGVSTGSITITPQSGPALTVRVEVTLSSTLISAASPLTETVAPGGSKQGTLAVNTTDGNAETVRASVVTADGGNWFQLEAATVTAPGNLRYTINAATLGTGNYTGTLTLACVSPSPCSPVQVLINLAVGQTKPVITSVLNATGGVATISQNTWIEVKGTNLSLVARTWLAADFGSNGAMPSRLEGVSATVNGTPAFVWYVSPTQINVLTPMDPAVGPVQVVVTNALGTSNAATVLKVEYSLGFFAFLSDKYVASTHTDGTLLGPSTLFPGLTTPAKPGEIIVLYGNGFGQVDPEFVPGSGTQFGVLEPKPAFTIGGLPAQTIWAGVVSPGLYQFNVQVPLNAPDGDLPVSAVYRSYSTHPGVVVTVKR